MVGRKRTTRNANNAPKKRKKATKKSPLKKVEKKAEKKIEKKVEKKAEKKSEKSPEKKLAKKIEKSENTEKKPAKKPTKKAEKKQSDTVKPRVRKKPLLDALATDAEPTKPRARKKPLLLIESPIEPLRESYEDVESRSQREPYDAFVEMEETPFVRGRGSHAGIPPLFIPEHRLDARVHESAQHTAHSPIMGDQFMGNGDEPSETKERTRAQRGHERSDEANGAHYLQGARTSEEKGHTRPVVSVKTNEIQGERVRITVRDMEIDDIATVFHLGEELFTSESYPMLYRTWDEYEVTGLFHADSDYCLVAEGPDEQLLGFVMGTTIDKGTAWTYGYVTWLGVAPGWQRAGVGQQLMDAIEDRMLEEEDVRMFIVDTSAHNVRGIRFFQRQGFEQMQKHVYLWKTLKGDAKARVRSVRKRRRARRLDQTREEQKKG